jgi:transcriptional regulator with XRE-family HTH domain
VNNKTKSSLLRTFGEQVRTRRLCLQWSQEQLAATAGLHRTYIGMIERAEKNITIVNAEKVAVALGCGLGELFNEA